MNKLLIPIFLSFTAGSIASYVVLSSVKDKKSSSELPDVNKYRTIKKMDSEIESEHRRLSRAGVLTTEGYAKYLSSDFIGLSERLKSLPDPERNSAQIALFTAWGKKDPEAAIAYLRKDLSNVLDSTERVILTGIYSNWAKIDPDSAVINLDKLRPKKGSVNGPIVVNSKSEFALAIAKVWAQRDPERALEYIKTENNFFMIKDYLQALYLQDPELTFKQLSTFDESTHSNYMGGIAAMWGEEEEWKQIQRKIENLPNNIQNSARIEALRSIVYKDLAEAQQIISNTSLDSTAKDVIAVSLWNNMVDHDVYKTVEWGARNISREKYVNLMNRSIYSWAIENIKSRDRSQTFVTEEETKAFLLQGQEEGELAEGVVNRILGVLHPESK